tara:strand:+ start:475 stop:720 length:246 start_codon:yes stop_codon:yes gene_type:complete
MVSEREVKRMIKKVIPNRQVKACARERIASRTMDLMSLLISKTVEYSKTDFERIDVSHVDLAYLTIIDTYPPLGGEIDEDE